MPSHPHTAGSETSGDAPATAQPAGSSPTTRHRFVSRTGIFLSVLAVTVLTLVGIFFGAREWLLNDVDEQARTAVSEQLDDFLDYAAAEADPNTGAAFGSSTRLLDVYLSTRIPESDESFAGIVDGRIIQMDRGDTPRRLEPGTPEIEQIAGSAEATGVVPDDDGTALHWGKVHVTSPEDSRPAVFVVARYTDAEHARATEILAQLQLLGLIGAGAAMPVALVLALWLGRKRPLPASAVAPLRDVHGPAATGDLRPAPHGDPTYSYRRMLAVTGRQIDEQINQLSPRTKHDTTLVPHVDRLRRLSYSLAALTTVLDPQADSEHLRIDSGELTWQLVQRIRHDSAQPVRLSSTATGQQVDVDPEHLRLALGEALQLISSRAKRGTGTPEFGTAFRGEGPEQVLSLWIRYQGGATATPPADLHGAAPPVMQAVAELHDGRVWVEEAGTLGMMLGIDVPVAVAADA